MAVVVVAVVVVVVVVVVAVVVAVRCPRIQCSVKTSVDIHSFIPDNV